MATPPSLNIPDGVVAKVSIIDTTTRVASVPVAAFMKPLLEGYETFVAPAYAFLVENPEGRKLIFDFGVRKDFSNYSPVIVSMSSGWGTSVEKGVAEILVDGGVDLEDIEALVWSHYHWDHIGDTTTLPASTKLIVGPGFKENLLPGYPANPQSPIQEKDYEGRELIQIDFKSEEVNLKIGRFEAIDYFGDGSFYLLNAPGHAVGHICGLARTSKSKSQEGKDTFIFMGADSCHHGAMIRPSRYLPIPAEISPNPLRLGADTPCPGALYERFQASRGRSVTEPLFEITDGGAYSDPATAKVTLEKLQEADASSDVLVVTAHDESLLDIVEFFPAGANDWKSKGWGENSRWAFIKYFEDLLH